MSIIPTTCPACGRGAEFHTDDGVTYCTSVRCGWLGIVEPLCSCGHDGRPGPGHQMNCAQYRPTAENGDDGL